MEVRLKEPMSCHTSFRTGGPADWFIIPDTPEELAQRIHRLEYEYYPKVIEELVEGLSPSYL